MKKQQTASRAKLGIFGKDRGARKLAALTPKAPRSFTLPDFDAAPALARIDARTALVKGKIERGELDATSVEAVLWVYGDILDGLDADLAAWKAQCDMALARLEGSAALRVELCGDVGLDDVPKAAGRADGEGTAMSADAPVALTPPAIAKGV